MTPLRNYFLQKSDVILAFGIALGFLILDAHPHMMLGDSQSYLTTGHGYYPPDRSWVYGLFAHAVLWVTHSLQGLVIVQTLLQAAVIVLLGRTLLMQRWIRNCFVVAASLDPLLMAYSRFYLSDSLANVAFTGFVIALASPMTSRRRSVLQLTVGCICGITAVLLRIAYVPIELAAILLVGFFLFFPFKRFSVAHLGRIGLGIATPFLATALLISANGQIFGKTLDHPYFLNRLSSSFLMAAVAPALNADDIRAGGVPINNDDVKNMQLGDYDLRINQLWGAQSSWLVSAIRQRCHITNEYDTRLQTISHAIVAHAFRRDPVMFATVYLRSLEIYFVPAQWEDHYLTEMGADRDLPPDFVSWLNDRLEVPVRPDSLRKISLVERMFGNALPIFPIWMGLTSLLSVFILIRYRTCIRMSLPAACVLSGMITVALYSNYVIPRYLLASELIGWLIFFGLIEAWLYPTTTKEKLS